MKILSLLIFYSVLFSSLRQTDSPHGSDFKIACSTCHSSKGWQIDKEIYSFDHNKTKLPLLGQHQVIDCRQCHTSLVFKEAKNECNQCHNDVHQATVGSDCSRCHTPASWLVNNISELHQLSRFPLIGSHRSADCYQCHKSESFVRFDVPGVECIDCHREDYTATTNPNHIESGLPEDCIQCHSITSAVWTDAGFNHSFFALVQGHSALNCTQCHTTGKYSDASPDCFSCHEQDYLASKEPDHVASGFSETCTDCHTLSPGWEPTTIDHSSFPLTLGHSVPACADCHIGGNYTTTPIDCYACHQQDFLATTDPNHQTSAFSITCTDCHTTNPGWKPTTIDHSSFPLTLGHSVPSCSDCHIGGNYTTTPIDCYACHQQDFQATTDPDHQTAAFSITCTDCHSTNPGWKPTTFDHSSFPLTEGHAVPTCNECHKGNYTTTSADCYSCHQQDYMSTTDPNHSASGFSHTCTDCHSTSPGWKPATFNHTSFPLTLGHAVPTCNDCHKGNYTSTPTDCYACHQADYNGSINPNHQSLGFSTVCITCHNTNPDWKPAKYLQHDSQFPIYSGKHQGQWNSCTDCHTNLSNYSSFSCIDCHEHNKTDMDNFHIGEGVQGYSWVSSECYRCHPRGTKE